MSFLISDFVSVPVRGGPLSFLSFGHAVSDEVPNFLHVLGDVLGFFVGESLTGGVGRQVGQTKTHPWFITSIGHKR